MAPTLHVRRGMKSIDVNELMTVVGGANLKSAVERGLMYGATGALLGGYGGLAIGTGVGLLAGGVPTPATSIAGLKVGAGAGFVGGFALGFGRDIYENWGK